jgi:hypothetical protein
MSKLIPKRKIILSFSFMLDDMNFISSSLSIIKNPLNDTQYIILVRCNYWIKEGSKTNNMLLTLDKNMNILNKKLIHYDFIKDSSRNGVEDIKLFNFDNKIYQIGTYKYDYIDVVSACLFDYLSITKNNENIITPAFKTEYTKEKNWVFFNWNGKLAVIYKWFPLQICEIDFSNNKLLLLKEIDMPILFENIRGSSCGVVYDDKTWFVVHKRLELTKYVHMFVTIDKNMNIRYSRHFNLEVNREFCYGLLIENDEVMLGYSTNNRSSNIAIFDYKYIKNDLKWFDAICQSNTK